MSKFSRHDGCFKCTLSQWAGSDISAVRARIPALFVGLGV